MNNDNDAEDDEELVQGNFLFYFPCLDTKRLIC